MQPGKQGDTAESRVGGGAIHHSLPLPKGQHPQLNNRETGPAITWCTELQSRTQPGRPRCVPGLGNNREGLQAREPSKCL